MDSLVRRYEFRQNRTPKPGTILYKQSIGLESQRPILSINEISPGYLGAPVVPYWLTCPFSN